jgi:hypothetical protein
MPICSEGHTSATADYCDVCGVQISTPAAQSSSPAGAATKACPSCGAPVSGRFCETCGHDSALPPPATPPQSADAAAPVVWTAVVAADREFHERVLARGGPDTVDFPQYFPERRITLRRDTTLIGRHNRDQGVDPEIDLGLQPADRGVSTQHAVLKVRDSALTVTVRPTEPASTAANNCWPTARKFRWRTAIASTSARGPPSRSRRVVDLRTW